MRTNRATYLFILATICALAAPAELRAQLSAQTTWVGTAGGTSTALTVSIHNINQLSDILGVPIRFLPSGVNTGASTLTINLDSGGTLGPVAIKKPAPGGIGALTGCELKTSQESTLVYDGTEFIITSNYTSGNPTYTHLTSGSGTYDPPTCATAIFVREVGGGGGGGGGGTSGNAGNIGTGGVASSFNSITASGGNPGGGGGGSVGSGGTPESPGSGATIYRYPGSGGGTGTPFFSGTTAIGGMGGSSCLGGGGYPTSSTGGAGGANTGGGGGGGSSSTSASLAGGGGASGECAGFLILNPSSGGYSYTVGGGGAAGSGGLGGAGGVGGAGDILVTELYD